VRGFYLPCLLIIFVFPETRRGRGRGHGERGSISAISQFFLAGYLLYYFLPSRFVLRDGEKLRDLRGDDGRIPFVVVFSIFLFEAWVVG
jgi:hypothetical protein